MKHNNLLISKIIISIFLLLGILFKLQAQNIELKTKDTKISINDKGYFCSIVIDLQEILHEGNYPLIMACSDGKLIVPLKVSQKENSLICSMSDNKIIVLNYSESVVCITFEVVSVAENYDAVILAPMAVNINETVGDVIGVVQGNGVAFGIQSLNIKTNAGIPQEYTKTIQKYFNYEGNPTSVSTATIPVARLAATHIGDGAMFQFSCRNRNKTEYRKVQQVEESLVLPVNGDDAHIKGAKIAIFGSKKEETLTRIGEIEIEQNLPHPMFANEWAKTSRSSMKAYMISDFSEENFDLALEKCKRAGFDYIYHIEPFETWGHFDWNSSFVKNDDASVKVLVDKAKTQGISVGIHTLSNFMTTNDKFVTPIPSKHLLKQTILTLTDDIDATQTDFSIKKSTVFSIPSTLNAMQIEDEIITFGTTEESNDIISLKNCKRGAFGTTAAAHNKEKPLFKLWDYPYKTLFPDLVLQDQFVDRLVEIFNNTGLAQISFDGLEGCTYTGQDDYATARFVSRWWNSLNHNVINDASNLNHFTWHIHTRMNWGEPWGETMRTGQIENRIKNQDFFSRNLFPRMLGWFLIRLADKKFECTSLEDLEWAMSEAAGFDAGYSMTIYMRTINRHGQIDLLLEAIKNWDELRLSNSFSDEQKTRLRKPETEWHLEKKDSETFLLYPLYISKHYHCNLAEMQPGQPGGADWQWDSPNESAFALRLRVDGDSEATIKNPTFTTQTGIIKFPCEIKSGQYLLYDFDGKAIVTDKDYNIIEAIQPQGFAKLLKGQSVISFSCEQNVDEDQPEVIVRYITRNNPETIIKK